MKYSILYPLIKKYETFKSWFLSMKYAVDKVILDSWSSARRRHWLIRLQLRIQQLFFLLLGRPHHNCCEKEGLGSRVEGCNYFIKSNTFEEKNCHTTQPNLQFRTTSKLQRTCFAFCAQSPWTINLETRITSGSKRLQSWRRTDGILTHRHACVVGAHEQSRMDRSMVT